MLGFIKRRLAEAREEENRVFREKYYHFRELLDRNTELLETIALLSDIRERNEWISLSRLRAIMTRTAVNVYRLIQNLNHITEGNYQSISSIYADLEQKIIRALEAPLDHRLGIFTVPLAEVNRQMVHDVGSKAANLGELTRREGIRVPRGVAITSYAYHRFLDHNQLRDEINKESLAIEPTDLPAIEELSATLKGMIMKAELPDELADALNAVYQQMCCEGKERLPVVLRSSAVGEDEAGASFAGLYKSILNPSAMGLASAYKEVIASKFSPRAMTYLLRKGLYQELYPMCAVIMELIPARAGGIMFTRDPEEPGGPIRISAVWGLGKLAVEGTVSPDVFWVSRQAPPSLLRSRVGDKSHRLDITPEGGLVKSRVDAALRQAPCLSEDEVMALANLGLELEEYFGSTQDVEWVVDPNGQIYVVQSRPLQLDTAPGSWQDFYPRDELAAGPPPLVTGLQVGSAGAAAGRAVVMTRFSDAGDLPDGGIVLVKNTAPDLVNILPRAGAVVAERGNTSGHLAIIAREFGVPLMIGLNPELVECLTSLDTITVDAYQGQIFPGVVEPLLDLVGALGANRETAPPTPLQKLLDEVLQYVVPLNLLNPRDKSFRPQSIRTIHDIIRFAHETSINAMFDINDSRLTQKGRVVRLESPVPLDIYLIDLGGGLTPIRDRKNIKPEDIISIPMQALYRGMTTPGVRWAGHIPIDFKGFMSVFANTMFDGAKHERRLGDRSYAIVSLNYLNFSSRLGYHFSIVDAFVSDRENENYLSFRFKGGAASLDKRTRRVRFLQEVLERHEFWVDQKADLVNARVKRLSRPEMEEKLMMLGRLMGASRQLDVTMTDDSVVDRYVELFMAGNYAMGYGDQ
ncbi:MAG: hypothetical protein KQJ78_03040 [Deltaproteobacteria bacterium]|nr:hypothetical protein [Deltaproteobacteria bacterium]